MHSGWWPWSTPNTAAPQARRQAKILLALALIRALNEAVTLVPFAALLQVDMQGQRPALPLIYVLKPARMLTPVAVRCRLGRQVDAPALIQALQLVAMG